MSRPFLRILVTAVAILGFVGVPVAGQVTLSFASIPEQTLPGIPVNFRLTISSASAQPVILRNGALLEVTPENGAAFYVRSMGDDWYEPIQQASETEKWSDTISIQPASSRDYYWIVDCALTENAFFADRRLSKPGKYSLRIEVLPEGVLDKSSGQALWSNAATLTVVQPQGDDAAVWAMMLSRSGRDGFSLEDWVTAGQFGIADEIFAKYPHSAYLPYVACFKGGTLPERIGYVQAAMALNPKGPIADRLKLDLAALHTFIADEARASLDADGAIAELGIARQLARDVQAQSTYPFIREAARSGVDHVDSDEFIRKNVADLTADRRASPTPQVIPFVDCVSVQKDGGLTARFGYRNIKDQKETIQEGASNSIFPADAAKKLPTTFAPGERRNAFHATTTGGPVAWKLLSWTATATKDSKPCKGN